MTVVGHLAGLPVRVHWSLFALVGLILVGSGPRFPVAAIAIFSYFATVLLHEWGHVLFARRRRHLAFSIELYPMVGITRLEAPRTRWDQAVIAWGGIVCQAIVGLPCIAWVKLVGYTRFEVFNAILAFFAFLTVATMVVNLMPVPPLDGSAAWSIVPLFAKRLRARWLPTRPRRTGWTR